MKLEGGHICTAVFIAALVTMAKRRKQLQYLSTKEWKFKMRNVHSGVLLSLEKEGDLDICYAVDKLGNFMK